ncbi:fumarylacetoacetate hydrolase family protein [Mesorhizobium sp. M0904]|uniref:fumarylacetoacetate hydrolase family protein n=1 Tax=Mesorhizobium sp. M0904 TaxID=2957022 RepID=UPI00333A7048
MVVDEAVLQDVSRPAALEIQQRVILGLAAPVAAWKAAALPDGDLVSAPIVASRLFSSPCVLGANLYGRGGIECEIAFRFARAPIGGSSVTRAGVIDALDGACAAIEVVTSRWGGPLPSSRNAMIADLLANGALVCGPLKANWASTSFASLDVSLRLNGTVMHRATGGHPDSDLVGLLVRFVSDLGNRKIEIQPGTVVTTGSFTGLITAKPGDVVSAEFEGFEPVSVTFGTGGTAGVNHA